jgi:HpcH/HpaI aldolase/citrate lyase family
LPLPAKELTKALPFDLLLFTIDPDGAAEALRAGVLAIVVDCENRGKPERQCGADTQINYHTLDDLSRLRRGGHRPLSVRINAFGPHTPAEIDQAVLAGADEIFLPMVRKAIEVERSLRMVKERCRLAILIETPEAVEAAAELGKLPLSRVYVGLNDLAICRGSSSIFEALVDGTIERIRPHITTHFGVAGLTLPENGHPVPCRLLAGELVRLGCSFSFLRRSFWSDMRGRRMSVEVPRLLQFVEGLRLRDAAAVARDRAAFVDAVRVGSCR